jgi:hypothetical protein
VALGTPLKSLSLQGARQQFMHVIGMLVVVTKKIRNRLYEVFLSTIAEDLLEFRPFRSEPRVVKRRSKPFPRMTTSLDLSYDRYCISNSPYFSAIDLCSCC